MVDKQAFVAMPFDEKHYSRYVRVFVPALQISRIYPHTGR